MHEWISRYNETSETKPLKKLGIFVATVWMFVSPAEVRRLKPPLKMTVLGCDQVTRAE